MTLELSRAPFIDGTDLGIVCNSNRDGIPLTYAEPFFDLLLTYRRLHIYIKIRLNIKVDLKRL